MFALQDNVDLRVDFRLLLRLACMPCFALFSYLARDIMVDLFL